jgi:flagellar motor switch/type III secretory pathway protein FliN
MSDINNPELSVTLRFQVGEVNVPLSDLLALQEGSVIEGEPLHTYFPKVRAILNNQTIAEGELVKVDGQVGFRVTKVF